jgi:hypothetical protein
MNNLAVFLKANQSAKLAEDIDSTYVALETLIETSEFVRTSLPNGLDLNSGKILGIHINSLCRRLNLPSENMIPACEAFECPFTNKAATSISMEGMLENIKITLIAIYKAIIRFIEEVKGHLVNGFEDHRQRVRNEKISKLNKELSELLTAASRSDIDYQKKYGARELAGSELLARNFTYNGKADGSTVEHYLNNTSQTLDLFLKFEPVMQQIVRNFVTGFNNLRSELDVNLKNKIVGDQNTIDGERIIENVSKLYEGTLDVFEEFVKHHFKKRTVTEFSRLVHGDYEGYSVYSAIDMPGPSVALVFINDKKDKILPHFESITIAEGLFPIAIISPTFEELGHLVKKDISIFGANAQRLSGNIKRYESALNIVQKILGDLIGSYDTFNNPDFHKEEAVRQARRAYKELPSFMRRCVIGLFSNTASQISKASDLSNSYLIKSGKAFKVSYER